MTSLKYGGWRLSERWRSELMVWELRTLGQFGTLGNFKLSTNRLAILSAGQTFKHHTPSLIARASRLPQSVGGYKGISIVACQNSTPTRPKDISPRSRPTESGSARAYPVSAPLRRFSDFILSFRRRIIPFPVGGKSAFFILHGRWHFS